MCGICGIVSLQHEVADQAVIDRMNACLAHRGPDDRGSHVRPHVMLGHTRLSIIDLTDAGHQPMSTEDGQVIIAFNGEVYNFPELAAELRAAGFTFRSRSDTEVVLKAYVHWGEACFAKFNGMFGVAVWDNRAQRLYLARDRFGIKPLFYAQVGDELVFGSEIKAILASGRVEPRLNWRFLHEYMYYGNSLWQRSAFEGIEKVLPGTYVRLDRDGLATTRYWDIRALKSPGDNLDELTDGVRTRLEAAVKRHLIADVPVAVFLSGGIDSSAMTVYAARHYSGKLHTFSVGFDYAGFDDERPKARRLAEAVGTEHHELYVESGNVSEVIEKLVLAHDEPFADAANIPLYLLCRALGEHTVKVVLQGDGGDEIFAGYRRYNVFANEWLWRTAALPCLAALRLAPKNSAKVHRAQRFLRAVAQKDPVMRMALMMTMETTASPPTRVLSASARGRIERDDPFEAYKRVGRWIGQGDTLSRMLKTDCLLLLPDQFLPKVDRPTMAHAIEVRVPFLDSELTDYVIPIASRHKVRNVQKKFLLRRALRGTVPDYILDGPKRGFGVPYSHWLRTGLLEFLKSVLFDPGVQRSGLFDAAQLERAIEDHVARRRDNGFLLYKTLNLALWYRKYIASA